MVFYRKSNPFKSITLNIPQEGTAEEIERIEKPKQKTLYKVSYYRFSKILLSFEEADTAARVTAKPVLNGTEENKNRQAEQTTEEQSMQTKTSKRFPIDSRNVRRLGIFAALGTLATLLITLNRVGSNPKTGFDWFVIAVFPILFTLECAAHGFEFFGTAEFTESGVVFRAPFRKERVFMYKDLRSFGVDYSNNKEYCIFFSKEQNGPGGNHIVSTSFPERGFYPYSDDYMALRYSKEAYRALCDNVPTEIKNRMPYPWEERKRLPQNNRSFTVKEPLRESGK